MSEEPTLDELPEEVFVALGRRGMEGIPLKECAYECKDGEIELVKKTSTLAEIKGKGEEKIIEDYLVKCSNCNREFTIHCESRYFDGERFDTKVNIIDQTGKDLGWLGSY
ncbi:MAG: hypothetical protein BAJATHORv1_30416 [Candidatus Thorarchaeota archaeon]|nr:MAG: hypothetical protein BAJATHORv1_30416 [Candidatus Thorarchaeota archaeon]